MHIKTSEAQLSWILRKRHLTKNICRRRSKSLPYSPIGGEIQKCLPFPLSFQSFPMETNHAKACQLQLLDFTIFDNFDMPLMM